MKILKCFLSAVLILIFNVSFLSTIRTTEFQNPKSVNDKNNIENSDGNLEPKIGRQKSSEELHSSFSEEPAANAELSISQSQIEGQSVFKNIDIAPELSETSEAAVFTLIDTAAELENRVKPQVEDVRQNDSTTHLYGQPPEIYIVRAEPKTEVQNALEELEEKEMNESVPVLKSSQVELSKTAPQHEDIPSFREWTQKQLAEAKRKKVDQNSTSTEKLTKSSGKFRTKNYASPDCGAKIVSANPESVSSSSVLSSSKDEYMLNYCTNRIWFVIELCEAIQAKQLDLANFELFSSSPKDFAVSISHRFPTRDWSNIGKFTAKDSRNIQTFNLNPHLFGKYIKVELLSHYGKEQFCPVSWVGVYGTSEFEVLAKEDERHIVDDAEDDDEDLLIGQRRDAPKNLFISATDAVLSIVKKATAPFMKSESNDTRGNSHENSNKLKKARYCMTPRYITVCDNCSQSLYDEVFDFLSCRQETLMELISCSFVKRTLINTESCKKFGLDFNTLRLGAPFPSQKMKNLKEEKNYLTSLLKHSFVGALCNILAVLENKVVVNASNDIMQTLKNLTEKKNSCDLTETKKIPSLHCGLECKKTSRSTVSKNRNTKYFFLNEILRPSEQFSEKIEPTKTLNEEEIKKLPPSASSENFENTKLNPAISTSPTVGKAIYTATVSSKKEVPETTDLLEINEEPKLPETKAQENVKEIEPEESIRTNLTNSDSTFDSILSDINELERAVHSNPSVSIISHASNLPTESIFLRLANRIKNLEINMSLSSTYLEELSRRYRNQLEVLSKTINSTAQKIEERYRLEEERERLREKEILLLRLQLANLTRDMSNLMREKNSWRLKISSISQHIILVSIEIIFVWVIFSYWKRSWELKNQTNEQIKRKVKRRKSLEGVTGHNFPLRRKRRPSDEALEIAVSRSYNVSSLKIEKKRKRKKKDSKSSINMIHVKRKKSENSSASPEDITKTFTDQTAIMTNNVVESGAENLETSNRFAVMSSPILKNDHEERNITQDKLSPPTFIRTAISARNSRLRFGVLEKESSHTVSFLRKPKECGESPPREKKSSGGSLKKYMKKFFDK